MTLLLPTAQLLALFLETLFYGESIVPLKFMTAQYSAIGILVSTFMSCMKVLFLRKQPSPCGGHNWLFISVSFALFIVATMDIAFGFRHILDAFVYYKGPGGPTEELLDISYWVNVMKGIDTTIQIAIADAFLVSIALFFHQP